MDNVIRIIEVLVYDKSGLTNREYTIDTPKDGALSCLSWDTLKELQRLLNNFIAIKEQQDGKENRI